MNGSVGGRRVAKDDNKGTHKRDSLFRERGYVASILLCVKSPSSKLHGKVPVGHGKAFSYEKY